MSTVIVEPSQGTILNVLLVEDNPVDARLIYAFLKAPSPTLKCRNVARLADALECLQTDNPDVILLDLNLEDSWGYDTFYGIRQAAPKAALLVLSGSDDEELAIRTVREGAQDYLVKGSFDGKLLIRAVRYALERKRAEDALRQSETTVRAIFESSLDGIIIFDVDGICREANAAAGALVGVGRAELIGRRLCDFCREGFEEEWVRLRSRDSARGQFWVELPNGTRRLVDYCFTANVLAGQHLATLRDMTEQNSLEEQLRQSQKMEAVGRLAGGVAHDFNNILGIIMGYAELMQLNSQREEERSRSEKIIGATEKASSLTRQLLAFGRKQVMLLQLLDLTEVLEGLNSIVQCLMSSEVQICIHADADAGLVRADQSQVEQVLINLTTNARDAMPEGGTLTFAIRSCHSQGGQLEPPAGEYVRLSVSDTGVGMTSEIQSRIFEPFFTTKRTGSGLGLSTVYGIVKQSGGYITVESRPQQGSTFNVYLPMVAPKVPVPATLPAPVAVHAGGHETVLLVDNEEDLRNAATEFLQGNGYRVLTAADGKEAIEICDRYEGEISVLISDIVMPKLNGRMLVEYVRKTRPDAGILMISGYADEAVMRHGIALDPSCFLQKPFTFQTLSAKIRALLDRERSQPGS